jgi:hypothetical protein
MPILHAIVLGIALLPATAAAPKAQSGTASGTVKINGQTAQLKYAYLSTEKYDSGRKKGLVITISDVALDAAQAADEMGELQSLARKGQFHGIRVKVGEDKQVYSADIFHNALKNWPTTSISGMNEFEAQVFTPARVQGHAYMKAPWKGREDEIFYDATFDASGVKAK